jgi:predicted membrane protein
MFHDPRRRSRFRHSDGERDHDSDAGRDHDFDTRGFPRGFKRRGTYHSLVIGGLIAAFGLTLLATNLGWTDMRSALRQFWPFALVILGVANLFTERPGSQFWGIVMIVGGLWIYAAQRDWIHVSFWAVFGPTVLILLGATVVWRAVTQPKPSETSNASNADTSAYIHSFAVMSGTEHKPSLPFEGANVGAVMGGVKIDLTAAEMQGDTATIDVFAVMGGIEIFAPRDWEVTSKVVTFMGASIDKRRPAGQTPATRKTLVVRGFVFMGGIEIKD